MDDTVKIRETEEGILEIHCPGNVKIEDDEALERVTNSMKDQGIEIFAYSKDVEPE